MSKTFKKAVSLIFVIAMIAATLPNIVLAETTVTVATTDGQAATVGNTLIATVENAEGTVTYQWYRGAVAIEGATSDEYILTYDDQLNGPVKCVATIGGSEYSSSEITVTSKYSQPDLTIWPQTPLNVDSATKQGENHTKWTFKMKDNVNQSFTLLDTYNNSEGKYLVIANQQHSAATCDYTQSTVKYDPTVLGSHAATVISEAYRTSGTPLPSEMRAAINQNQVWVTETNGLIEEPYTVKASVVVPAHWELFAYQDRMDFDPLTREAGWWLLRTTESAKNVGTEENPDYALLFWYARPNSATATWLDDSNKMRVANRPSTSVSTETALDWTQLVYTKYRPMFCLNEDFFTLGGIDLSSAGSEITAILSDMTYDELTAAGYTTEEIEAYLPDVNIPEVGGVTVVTTDGNAATVGNTLKATAEEEGAATYQWYRGAAAIEGATSDEYILTYDDQLNGPVKCVATIGGSEYSSSEITVTSKYTQPDLTIWPQTPLNVDSATKQGENHTKWTFKMKDNANQSFTLLDTYNNSEGKYLMIANQQHSAATRDYTQSTVKYDPTVSGSHAKLVIEEAYRTSGTPLPAEMRAAINENQVWVTETNDIIEEPYTVKASVVVPAHWELFAYQDRMDFDPLTREAGWWLLRTTESAKNVGTEENPDYALLFWYARPNSATATWLDDSNKMRVANRPSTSVSTETALDWTQLVYTKYRPMFCLNEDFFTLGGIDLSSAGSEIINILSQMSYKQLAAAGYTEDEIRTYLPTVDIVDADYRIIDIGVTDGVSETEVDSLEGLTTICANVSITSYVNTDAENAILIAALYNENNSIIKMNAKAVSIGAKATVSESVILNNLTDITDDCTLKIFLWDGFANAKPLAAVKYFEPVTVVATAATLSSATRSQVFF